MAQDWRWPLGRLVDDGRLAARHCEDVKSEIAAKLDAKGVKAYTLDIVADDAVKDQKVVGSCEGGTKKIVYTRRGAAPSQTPAANP